jgi:MprA protease rhombosortase-interaction domain-containing protein
MNNESRIMRADLSTQIDLNQQQETYVTFLVRENTAPLSATQLASSNRTLTLDFLNSGGATQFDFALRGQQHQFAIDSVADAAGQDVAAGGFASDTTYMFVGKISGNGSGANTMQASLFASGSVVANFTDPGFQWMLTATGSAGFNPVITKLQFTSQSVGNFTVSNVWIGGAATMLPPTLTSQGDFNKDGEVNSADYVVWRNTIGQSGSNLAADGNGNYQVDVDDYRIWRSHFGMAVTGAASGEGLSFGGAVPEPSAILLLLAGSVAFVLRRSGARDS